MTPTARTLKHFRDLDIPAAIVEKWVRFSKPDDNALRNPGVRRDLFGMFDIIALVGGFIVGVQCCAMSGRAAHVAKVQSSPHLRAWIEAGGRAEVWAWRKVQVKRGGKRMIWKCEVTEVPAMQPQGA